MLSRIKFFDGRRRLESQPRLRRNRPWELPRERSNAAAARVHGVPECFDSVANGCDTTQPGNRDTHPFPFVPYVVAVCRGAVEVNCCTPRTTSPTVFNEPRLSS